MKSSLFIVSALLLVAACANALSLVVEPHSEKCFFEDIEAGSKLQLAYEVSSGGALLLLFLSCARPDGWPSDAPLPIPPQ